MTAGIDILHLFPALATIGQSQLQKYCDEWLKRPIAREYAVAQIAVDENLLLRINLAVAKPALYGDRAFIPIDELLGYIVDRHFVDPDQQRELHASIREARRQWGELKRDYEVTIGRLGTLYLNCKACSAELETQHRATEGQEVICPPTDVTCPLCGATATYEANDLVWRAD